MIVLDDMGFAQLGCFGSGIATPNIDRLADNGLRYNRFHVTAICSPTRAALLTGRNHQRVGNGTIAERAVDWDGYTGVIPKTSATVAERLNTERIAISRPSTRPITSLPAWPMTLDAGFGRMDISHPPIAPEEIIRQFGFD